MEKVISSVKKNYFTEETTYIITIIAQNDFLCFLPINILLLLLLKSSQTLMRSKKKTPHKCVHFNDVTVSIKHGFTELKGLIQYRFP